MSRSETSPCPDGDLAVSAKPGLLLSVDGPCGVGKSTAVQAIGIHLRKIDIPAVAIRQPSTGLIGSYIRAQIDSYTGMALACLIAGDRHHQQRTEIEPALAAGRVVICDRYLPSSLVLQVRDGVGAETVQTINAGIRTPDLAVFLRAEPNVIDARMQARGGPRNRFHREADDGSWELEMFDDVAAKLTELGWPVHIIDTTSLSRHEIADQIANLLVSRLGRKTTPPM